MAETSLNLFDLGVLLIVGLSALLSFYRGFVSEVLSLATWLAASYITLRFLPVASHMLEPYVKMIEVRNGVAAVALFFTSLILISIATGMLRKFIKTGAKAGLFDNLMGLCFGAARGLLIVAIAYFILGIVMVEKDFPKVVKEAKTRPFIAQIAQQVAAFAPNYLDSMPIKKSGKDSSDDDAPGEQKIIRLNGDGVSTMPSLNDLQKRIHEENEKNNVR